MSEEIIAERAWIVTQDAKGVCLESLAHPMTWGGPSVTADRLPTMTNENGIYAQKMLEPGYKNSSAWGTVALSGVVVCGERGYRAERATIRSLRLRFLPTTSPIRYLGGHGYVPMMPFGGQLLAWPDKPLAAYLVAEQLAERYQCECVLDWIPQSTLPADYVTV